MKRLKFYLAMTLVAFVASTTGADVLARMSIAGKPFSVALQENLHYARIQLIGTILLLAPFFATALICAYTEKYARFRSVFGIFVIATCVLVYFYFQGHFAAQQAMKEEHWTAAALSVGLLPFFIGAPVLAMMLPTMILAAKLDPRPLS